MRLPARAAGLLAASLLTAACAKAPPETASATPMVEVEQLPEWRSKANEEDRGRIERLSEAWAAALGEARAAGHGKSITEEGELLVPDAALAAPAPPPGSYRCRMIKLGTQGAERTAFAAFKSFFCYVEAEDALLNITKQTGSERPAGWLYPDGEARRLVFLGSLALGDEKEPLPYGASPERDMVGVVERVAPYRYRLVVPWPRQESKLYVVELVPAPPIS